MLSASGSPDDTLSPDPVLYVLTDIEDPCATVSGLFLRPTDGALLFLAQCYGCQQLGTAECQHDSQWVGKQASSDCCLGVAVLTYRFLYRECLLIQEERDCKATLVSVTPLSGCASVTYKDGGWKHLSLGKNEAFSGETVSSRV